MLSLLFIAGAWRQIMLRKAVVVVGLGGITFAAFLISVSFGAFTSSATQAPRLSLDMVVSGNTYDSMTNSMTLGSLDNCLTTNSPGNNAQHNHTAHLVIQDVEDLVGWQAQVNYDGGKMRPLSVNFTPFIDNNTGQNVSFANVPIDSATAVHRDVVGATNIPPAASGLQTALIGASYLGAQDAAVSPDTPAKQPPDDTSYSAPSGGILAAMTARVLAGQAGMPGLYLDLDDHIPNKPGSLVVVFTGSGIDTISPTEVALGDGFHGEGVPCTPIAAPPPPPSPTFGIPPAPVAGNAGTAEIVRWGNVTVRVPENSAVSVSRQFLPAEENPPDGGPVLYLERPPSRLIISAETGAVLYDSVRQEDKLAFDQIATTKVIGAADEMPSAWPYAEGAPPGSREVWGNLALNMPGPSSGIELYATQPYGGPPFIRVSNGRSRLFIDAQTGAVLEDSTVILPEDKEAFGRFLATVRRIDEP